MKNGSMSENSVQLKHISSIDLRIFESMPGSSALLLTDAPRYTILAATSRYLLDSFKTKKDLVGKGLFEAFPANENDPKFSGEKSLSASFEAVIASKKEHFLPEQRYDIPNSDGVFIKRYWQASNRPVLADDGTVCCIIHTAEEITDEINAQQREMANKGMEQAHALFMQAPISIHMIKGYDLIIDMANEPTLRYWGRSTKVVGKPLMEALPELEGQGYDEFLREVLKTGQTKEFYEAPVTLNRYGKKEVGYFNFIYKPYFEEGNPQAVGIVTVSTEVTDKVLAKKELEESQQTLQLAIEIGGLGVFKVDLKGDKGTYSQQIVDWFGLVNPNLTLSQILLKIHPADQAMVSEVIDRSIAKEWAGRHDITYRVMHPVTGRLYYLRAIGQVQFEADVAVSISGIIQDVTAQALARKKVEESEERFRLLADQVPQFIWMTGSIGIEVTYANKTFLDFLGLSNYQEFLGTTWETVIHPDDIQKTYTVYGAAFAARQPYQLEVRFQQGSTGAYKWFLLQGVPRYEAEGKFGGFIGTGIDLNERKQVEESLKESESRFRSLIEEAPIATCLFVGREMVIEIANQRMIDIWGKGNTVLGKPLAQALPELTGQHFLPLLDELFTTGKTYEAKGGRADLEIDNVLKTFYFDYSFKPIHNAAGKIYAILEMAQDVTEQVLSKKKIEESRQNLRNMILQAPVAMCILKEPEFIVEIANERMFELWGKPGEEVINKPIFEGLPEAGEQGLEILLRNVYTTGETFKAFERPVNLPRNGRIETTYLNFVYEALYESNGLISGIMVVAIDVTEQVLARLKIEDVVAKRTLELAEANKALQQNNRELEQFAYITSHDLQEPLRKVSTFTDILRTHLGQMDERSNTYLNKISISTARMMQLIKDVLNFSQLSTDREVFKPVSLAEVVTDIIFDFELLIEQKEAVINYINLPTIEAIAVQMRQLFSNLVSNALKFTKKGVQPVITITAQPLPEEAKKRDFDLLPDKPYFLIQVEDNGIGFEEEYADKIFGIFQRLHGKAEYTGTGIGLALCKKIAQNHHGEIWATSVKNKGSVFNIILPEKLAGTT